MRASLVTLRSLAIPCVALALAPTAPAQQLVRSVNGPTAGAQFGKACITIADQNGDGYKDLLVGAPGFNQLRGAVYCLSGGYLATGAGTQTLWSVTPTANQGDLFGSALASVGDVTGDGVVDFVAGQPGYDTATSNDCGAIRLINGVTHAPVSLIYGPDTGCMFGRTLVACGDADGDGVSELAVGAPGPSSSASFVFVFHGGLLAVANASATVMALWSLGAPGADELGSSLAIIPVSGGSPFLLVGAAGQGSSSGVLIVIRVSPFSIFNFCDSPIAGERFGASLDAAHDYDGDGVLDVVVGAPNAQGPGGTQLGRAAVLSGARLVAQTPPYEIYDLTTTGSSLFNTHFGAAVRACRDLNGDGVGEILVGAPDYASNFSSLNRGFLSVFSGATGVKLESIVGATGDHFGDSIAGAVDDLDGDGFKEFVFAGALSDAGGADSGVVKCYRLFPVAPSTYCTAKVNSLGCTPAISFSGSPSASALAPFAITASNFINQKTGLLFYSHDSSTTAFQGGFKCAGDPVRRTGALNSGGTPSGSDCTGAYSLDFNARIASGVDPSLVAGAEVFAQYWSRDPASASHTSLSNAVRFVINP